MKWNPRSSACLALVLILTIGACAKAPDDHIEAARQHLAQGRDRAAAIELRNAVALAPDHAQANFLLGQLLARVGNPADAEFILANALKFGYAAGDLLPLLSEVQLEMEKYAQALETLKADVQGDRKVLAALAVQRGRAYTGLGSFLDARTQFQLALNDLPAEATLGLARLAMARGDRDEADTLLETLLAQAPDHAGGWIARGDLRRQQGRDAEALEAFRRASSVAPDNVVAILSEAIVHLTRDELDRAKPLLERATKVAPLKPLLEFANGLLALKERRFEDTRAALQRLLEAVPQYPPALLLAGTLNHTTEQYDLAENAFTAYLKRDPGSVYARKMLASTLLAKGRPASALKVLEPFIAAQADAAALALAGRAFFSVGRFARAVELFKTASGLAPNDADLRIGLGLVQLGAGQRAQAVTSLESAIALRPKHGRADHALTMLLLADKQVLRAEQVVADLAQRMPDSPEVYTLQGTVALARNDLAAARKRFEQALVRDPAHLPAVEALADIEQRAGKPGALRTRMEALLAADANNLEALLVLARLDMDAGEGEKSVGRIRQLLAQHPRSLRALVMLAEAQLMAGQANDAIASARRASEEPPWDSGALNVLADAQFASGDPAAAIVTLSRLAAMQPGHAEPQLRLAQVEVRSGDLRGAVSRIRAVLRTEPGHLRAREMLGEVFVALSRNDEALGLARGLQRSNPASAVGFRLEGDVWLATGNGARAADAYAKADALQSNGTVRVLLHRARTLASGQSAPTAALHDWLRRYPGDDAVRLYLGDAYSEAGEYRAAVEQYAILIKRRPEDFRVLNNLAWALQQTGASGALDHAEKAIRLRPEDPKVLDTFGYVLMQNGRVPEAVQVLLRATAKAPDHPVIRFHLAQALAKVGDIDRARKELRALQAQGKPFGREREMAALAAQLGL